MTAEVKQSKIVVFGLSYRTAGVGLRGDVSFDLGDTVGALRDAFRRPKISEALVLSTCNRTEFYFVTPEVSTVREVWLGWIGRWRRAALLQDFAAQGYNHEGPAAVRHLARVASGLDSSVLGDVQILSQVKAAMRLAEEARTLCGPLQHAVQCAVRAGRRSRHETVIAQGAPTVGSALDAILDTQLNDAVTSPRIVIIGAGKAARTIGRHIRKRRLGDLTFVNRTLAKAEALARHCGGQARPMSELKEIVLDANVIVAATSAPSPILPKPIMQEFRALRSRPVIVVDAGVPSNVERIDGVEIIDIDSIRERQESDQAVRASAIPSVEDIIEHEVAEWVTWEANRPVEGLIRNLYQNATALSQREARRLQDAGELSESEAEAFLYSSFKNLLHDHVRQLRKLTAEIGSNGS